MRLKRVRSIDRGQQSQRAFLHLGAAESEGIGSNHHRSFHSLRRGIMSTEITEPSPRGGPGRYLVKVLDELGLVTIWKSSLDVKLLCAQRFVRLFAYGGSTLILAAYLSALGISDDRIGLFMTLTLVGDVVISFILTLFADAMGRKAVLALGSALMAASGVIFGMFSNFWILLAAAVFGVISPRFVHVSTGPLACCH